MTFCLLCFSDEPVEDDPRYGAFYGNPEKFQIGMQDALCTSPGFCCMSFFCMPCVACFLRCKALEQVHPGQPWTQNYSCGQGYLNCCCCKSGSMGESTCPHLCMCLESYCCIGLMISATRLFVMDSYRLQPDPCDNRLIRFNNCIQLLSCICNILAAVTQNDAIDQLAAILDAIAQLVFLSIAACMQTQTNYELDHRKQSGFSDVNPPQGKEMGR